MCPPGVPEEGFGGQLADAFVCVVLQDDSMELLF